jgi:hypothetical protein
VRSTSRRIVAATLSMVTTVGIGLAGPARATAAVSCYGGATSYTIRNGDKLGTFTASTRCRDVNVRVTRTSQPLRTDVRVCFVDAGYCNAWRVVHIAEAGMNEWVVAASDVRDGVRFNIETDLNSSQVVFATMDVAY